MPAFDPRPLAKTSRDIGLGPPVESGRQRYEPDRIGHAGVQSVWAIVLAWFLGERDRYADTLTAACQWMSDAEQRGEQFGDDPALHTIRRRRALAIARWMLHADPCPALWQAAAKGGVERLAAHPDRRESPTTLSGMVLDWLAAGRPDEAAVEVARLGRALDAEGEGALAVARILSARGASTEVSKAVGVFLRAHLDGWLDEGEFLHAAAWLKFAFWDCGATDDPEAALLTIYALLPDIALPPALEARGWTAGAETALVPLPAATAFERIDRMIVTLGLDRDADRALAPAGSAFASWTGPEGDNREIDYHADGTSAHLEIRGRRARMLANVLATAFHSRIAPSPEAALADLMTPPRGPSASRSGSIRWRSLQAALAAMVNENASLVRSMIAAGLRDPDWRVRMLAVLATGKLRLAELAERAMAAKVPDAGTSGLDQEDRRTLLALRHAAHNLALGLEAADGIAGAPDVLDRRVAYQEQLRRLIDAPPATITDRASALVAILTGRSRAAGHAVPGAWRRWMDE